MYSHPVSRQSWGFILPDNKSRSLIQTSSFTVTYCYMSFFFRSVAWWLLTDKHTPMFLNTHTNTRTILLAVYPSAIWWGCFNGEEDRGSGWQLLITSTRRHAQCLVSQECPGSVLLSANRRGDKATKIKGVQHDYVLEKCEWAAMMQHSVWSSDQTDAFSIPHSKKTVLYSISGAWLIIIVEPL